VQRRFSGLIFESLEIHRFAAKDLVRAAIV
jgi:hypothetical protein